MRIGVLSDTHGDIARTEQAACIFERWRVEQVVHCGDIGSAEVVWLLEAWPTHFVFGNVDNASRLEREIHEAGKTAHGRFGALELEGRQIAFLHGDDRRLLGATIQSGRWDLVCCGHTHVAESYWQGSTLVLNPGAVHRSGRPSVAVVELPGLAVTPVLIDP